MAFQRTYQTDQLNELTFDFLLMFSRIGRSAMGVSHGVLMQLDSVVEPMYFVPGELTPRSEVVEDGSLDQVARLNIYPNPSSGAIYIKQPDRGQGTAGRVEVVDAVGRVVLSIAIERDHQWPLEMRVSDLHSGVFFIRMISQSEIVATGVFSKL